MKKGAFKLDFNPKSSEPKYKQIASSIIENIEAGYIDTGFQLPSITQLSIDYLISRDTVERAYHLLKQQRVIEAVMGKGFYVLASSPQSKLKIFVLFNKLSSYKKVVYDSLVNELGNRANLELFIYHSNLDLFETYIKDKLGKYNFYVIMSHIDTPDKGRIAAAINQINPRKLILLDNLVEGVWDFKGAVYQDFESDIHDVLTKELKYLRVYEKIIFAFPENVVYPYPKQILSGFKRFCGFNQFDYEILNEIADSHVVNTNCIYLVIEENDLATLIKKIRQNKKLKIGQNVGILSYNDTPLKEVLLEGISVITTDFESLGRTAGKIILGEEQGIIRTKFRMIKRNTL